MGIKKLTINKDNISKITEPKQKSNRIIFNRIGYCSVKPITDAERIYAVKEGIKEVRENIKKKPK